MNNKFEKQISDFKAQLQSASCKLKEIKQKDS
jgi:hypothetical protein